MHQMKKAEIVKMWIENSPEKDLAKKTAKKSKEALNHLWAWLTIKPRFFNPLFFKTDVHKPLEWFLTTDAIENFTKNKLKWWREDDEFCKYDILVREHCKSNHIKYESFPYAIGSHTTVMLEWIYDLKIPLGYMKHHPNGFISLIDLQDDQIIPYVGMDKKEIKDWFKDNT